MREHSAKKRLIVLISSIIFSLVTIGCDSNYTADEASTIESSNSDSIDTVDFDDIFSGCYTITPSEPAQIKISEQSLAGKTQMVMQMQEPKFKGRIWDNPEPLEKLSALEGGEYFDVDAEYIQAILARPDRLMLMAKVDEAYVNINPLLDSDYLIFIYKDANTIFQVNCDEVYGPEVSLPAGHPQLDAQ